jgi:hypothetical protein
MAANRKHDPSIDGSAIGWVTIHGSRVGTEDNARQGQMYRQN